MFNDKQYQVLADKVMVIIDRIPMEVSNKAQKESDGITYKLSFPCGWFKTLEIWYRCLTPKANNKVYGITHMFLTTPFHTYELDRNKFNMSAISERVMKHRDTISHLNDRNDQLQDEEVSLKATRLMERLLHRIR